TGKVTETMRASAEHVEEHCLSGPLVLGERFSIADPYLYVVCNWLPGDGVDLAGFPAISAFMEAMAARPSVQGVRADGLI
ncbi:glutathione S-transferase C-terminal domain-containing protein, partial [Cribrihabitans sp. XS_ASV171]